VVQLNPSSVRGRLAAAILVALCPATVLAFPPYHSTDAETADPWTLEARLGLIRVEREAGKNEWASPLLRVNVGLPHRLEVVSEIEYLPAAGRLGDAAVGVKWVPFLESLSFGIETLALLPVSSAGGAGVEISLLATHRVGELVLTHLNLSGFHDARPSPAESGWKAGLLGELRLGRFRPGVEIFARQVRGEPAQVLAGPGVILKLGPIDLRSGIHFGLTPRASDVAASLWVASALPLAD
jgi:hypothetical protein